MPHFVWKRTEGGRKGEERKKEGMAVKMKFEPREIEEARMAGQGFRGKGEATKEWIGREGDKESEGGMEGEMMAVPAN
jgi:hypothetical protein